MKYLRQCKQGDMWFLIDLESADKTGKNPGAFKCKAWTPCTLVDGLYTTASDIEMVGRLFKDACSFVLSEPGTVLSQRMRCANALQRPSAIEALDNSWFRGGEAL